MQCPSCGAMVEVEPNSTAKDCPYCGTAFVLAEKQTDVIVPDGVVPFQIDKKKVGEVFHKWIKGRFFAPNELKHLYQQDKLQGIYIPYWTFDAKADAVYHAEGGRNRIVEYRDSKGERHTRTEVTWYPTSGNVSNFSHVPYHVTWAYEQHEGEIRHPNFIRLDSIKGILDKL